VIDPNGRVGVILRRHAKQAPSRGGQVAVIYDGPVTGVTRIKRTLPRQGV
jgi:hypothetical protein